jgi:hypothetical protein
MSRSSGPDDPVAGPVKRPLLGCAFRATVVAAAALGTAVYLLGRWGSINGALRAAAILLVILGALFLIPFGLVLLATLAKWYLKKRFVEPLKESLSSARQTFEMTKKIYVDRHVYREARPADFVGRDRDWYDAVTAELTSLGYRRLADRVNQTVEEASGVTVVMRALVSADGTTMAAVYQFVKPNKRAGSVTDLRVCDFESELDNGTFITTNNSESSNLASVPPQIKSSRHPADTPPVDLDRFHETAKQLALANNPGTTLTVVRSLADYDAAQRRQQAIKAAFRKGVGYVDPAEIRRIADQRHPGDVDLADRAEAGFEDARRESELDDQNP